MMTMEQCASRNTKLLKELLELPSKSRQESRVVQWLMDHCEDHPEWAAHKDEMGNVYVTKGSAEHYPCVCAHTDTVHEPVGIIIQAEGDKLYGRDGAGRLTGCGGDDKAGIYICLQLLEKLPVLKAVFFVSEEIGCRGARGCEDAWFKDVGYVLEFDAPCEDILSFTSNGIQLFSVEGPFFETMFPVINRFGVTNWQHHPYTDVHILRQKFTFPCMNLPAGYYRWHCHDEYVQVSVVENSVQLGLELVTALGHRRYTFTEASPGKEAQTPVPVTSLKSHDFGCS